MELDLENFVFRVIELKNGDFSFYPEDLAKEGSKILHFSAPWVWYEYYQKQCRKDWLKNKRIRRNRSQKFHDKGGGRNYTRKMAEIDIIKSEKLKPYDKSDIHFNTQW